MGNGVFKTLMSYVIAWNDFILSNVYSSYKHLGLGINTYSTGEVRVTFAYQNCQYYLGIFFEICLYFKLTYGLCLLMSE